MFKSAKEFDIEVCNVLIKMRDGIEWRDFPENFEEDDKYDIFQRIKDSNFARGLTAVVMSGDGICSLSIMGEPQITPDGRNFIEQHKV